MPDLRLETTAWLAKRLGVSRRSAQRFLKRHGIPLVRVAGKGRFDVREVEKVFQRREFDARGCVTESLSS